MNKKQVKVIFPCLHYFTRDDAFKRILGYSFEQFKEMVDFLMVKFPLISFDQLDGFLKGNNDLPDTCSVLSFDDGLHEHAKVIAPYLAKRSIPALFAVPTCIFDGEMALPQVVHFVSAHYGVRKLYGFLKEYFPEGVLRFYDYFDKSFESLPLLVFYDKMKHVLRYKLPLETNKKLLSAIYHNVLKKDYPNILSRVYLNEQDLPRLKAMGHTIACHTQHHFSFVGSFPDALSWQEEVLDPKSRLEAILKAPIDIFSYPYGRPRNSFDVADWTDRLKKAGFRYVLNCYRVLEERPAFDPYWVERFAVHSQDTVLDIQNNAYQYIIKPNK